MKHNNNPVQMLQSVGLRPTAQRRTVLTVLLNWREPSTAEEIYQRACEQTPDISLPTVYRTLSTLTEAGIVEARHLSAVDDLTYFELADAQPRFSFTCLDCGKRLDFHNPHIASIRRDLATTFGVAVTEACTCLSGYCKQCLDKRSGREEKEVHELLEV